jgi:predicted PurR-regulated permease PerM
MKTLEISRKTILFIFVFLIGAFILSKLTSLLILLFMALILASSLNPIVRNLQRIKIPRPLAILITYIVLLSTIVGAMSFVVPPLVRESVTLIAKLHLPQIPATLEIEQLQQTMQDYEQIVSRIGTSIPSVMNAIFSTFSGVLVVFTFLMVTYYLLIEHDRLHFYLTWIFGHTDAEKHAKHFIERLEFELGGWVRGQLFLMFVIGLVTYIGLSLLGVPYALPLAILAGLLEVVPNLGPTIASIPAIILAFITISPAMGVAVIIFYIIVQQLENNIIVPRIMAASVNISPLVTILALIAGLQLGGVPGSVLAVPSFIFLRTIVREFYHGKNPLRTLDHTDEQSEVNL